MAFKQATVCHVCMCPIIERSARLALPSCVRTSYSIVAGWLSVRRSLFNIYFIQKKKTKKKKRTISAVTVSVEAFMCVTDSGVPLIKPFKSLANFTLSHPFCRPSTYFCSDSFETFVLEKQSSGLHKKQYRRLCVKVYCRERWF